MFYLEKHILKAYTFKLYIAGSIITSVIMFPICWNEFIKIQFSFSSFPTFILLLTEILYNIFVYIISSLCFGIVSYWIIYAVAILILAAKNRTAFLYRCLAFIAVILAFFLFLFAAYKSYGLLMVSELDKERNSFNPKSDFVYVTETGSKYHLSNCPTLKSISDKLYVHDAEGAGYDPCRICDPLGET